MNTLWQDVRYALRGLGQSRTFTLVAVLTLALGIGANTAIFSVVKAVLLNSLPYAHADRLMFVAEADPRTPRPETVDFATTSDWRERNRTFEKLSLYRDWNPALIGSGEPEIIPSMRVSWDYFETLGVRMERGRSFLKEEDQPDRWRVLILTNGLWQRRFGGDPNIAGRTVQLNSATYLVAGVLPAGFRPLHVDSNSPFPEMYAPLGYGKSEPNACRGCQHLHLIGRLKPGATAAEASADLSAILSDLMREYPKEYDNNTTARVEPLQKFIVGDTSKALWVLLGAVGLVLLIACVNVANLLLARAIGRERELTLRAALGAARARLVRQLLTESLLLALAGGAAGVVLVIWGMDLLVSAAPKEIPRLGEIAIDTSVLAFSVVATLLTGILFGLVPALRASRINLSDSLKDAARATESGARHGLRSLLVAGQLALTFLLVVGAALLGRSFLNLTQVNPGFDPHNVLTLSVYLWGERYRQPEVELNFYREVMEKTRALPGVESVGMVSTVPFSGFDRRGFHIQHRPLANSSDAPSADGYSVTPDYFRVMRIPLIRGRLFTEADRQGAPLVALISETCAREQFANEDPIGKHIQLGGRHDGKPWMTVVGVVGDVQQYALDRPVTMQAYQSQAQDISFGYTMMVRASANPQQFESAIRNVIHSVDKTQPAQAIVPLEGYLAASLAQRRFTLMLLGAFGVLALLMAGVGTYGVISYSVSLRTRELGIRMALGAQTRDVLAMVLRQGLSLAAAGLAAGFLASLALTRVLSNMLYEVRAHDAATITSVAGLLVAVTFLACYVPARRATKVDPMVALRYE